MIEDMEDPHDDRGDTPKLLNGASIRGDSGRVVDLKRQVFVVIKPVDVEFDPTKDSANIEKHGLSLAMAADLDLLAAAVVLDDRFDYQEARFQAFGRIGGRGYCLAFTVRDETVRAISLRRAHDKEMRRYDR